MYLVTVPEGCVCKAGGFRFISIGNLGMFRSAVEVENTFDIRETLQIIGNQEMSQIFNDFDKKEKTSRQGRKYFIHIRTPKALDETKPGAHHIFAGHSSNTRGISNTHCVMGRLETMSTKQTCTNQRRTKRSISTDNPSHRSRETEVNNPNAEITKGLFTTFRGRRFRTLIIFIIKI